MRGPTGFRTAVWIPPDTAGTQPLEPHVLVLDQKSESSLFFSPCVILTVAFILFSFVIATVMLAFSCDTFFGMLCVCTALLNTVFISAYTV